LRRLFFTCYKFHVMTRLRGLLLDFDGTIAETERHGHLPAYNRAFEEMGLDWAWSEELYADLLSVAGGIERIGYYLRRYRPDQHDAVVNAGIIPEIHRAKGRHFAKVAASIPFRPGFTRLIREAHECDVRVAIATTAAISGVEALLGQDPGVLASIDLIAAGDSVERKKPEPDVYLWALQKLGLDARDCVAIEDSNVGLRAALAAGLTTLVTVSDFTAHDDFTGAAAVLPDLNGVDLAYLERLLPA